MMAKIMRQNQINETQMSAILQCLHIPEFDLNKLAPSIYYLKKIEENNLSFHLVILFYIEILIL